MGLPAPSLAGRLTGEVDACPPKPYASSMTTAPRKTQGRPKVDEPRERVTIRLRPSEYDAFKLAADRLGIPTQTWIRMVCIQAAGVANG